MHNCSKFPPAYTIKYRISINSKEYKNNPGNYHLKHPVIVTNKIGGYNQLQEHILRLTTSLNLSSYLKTFSWGARFMFFTGDDKPACYSKQIMFPSCDKEKCAGKIVIAERGFDTRILNGISLIQNLLTMLFLLVNEALLSRKIVQLKDHQ